MKQNKWIILLLVMVLIIGLAPDVRAASFGTLAVSGPETTVQAGQTFTVNISLENYDAANGISLLQIDVSGIDPEILEVVSWASLINDTAAYQNTAVYIPEENLVRLVYGRTDQGVLPQGGTVMSIIFRVKQTVYSPGSLTLPIAITAGPITALSSESRSVTIDYEPLPADLENLEITWGALDYTYSRGTWNYNTHIYENPVWDDGGSGTITVKNTGTQTTAVTFHYDSAYDEISGSFTQTNLLLKAGDSGTVALNLSGQPATDLEQTVIGTIYIRVGGE